MISKIIVDGKNIYFEFLGRSKTYLMQTFWIVYFLILFLMGPSNISAQILFENVTASSGIIHSDESFGVSWGDFNSDGWPDIWVSNHGNPSGLYLNQGDGTFTDIAEEVLNAENWADTHGAAWGDFDNDGDQDLIQLVGADSGTGSGPNQLLKNLGVGFLESFFTLFLIAASLNIKSEKEIKNFKSLSVYFQKWS